MRADVRPMVDNMRFVGGTVDDLRKHGETPSQGQDVAGAAEAFLASLEPIGDNFDLPWKFAESLEVLAVFLPAELRQRLERPGGSRPTNHLEACIVALALEAGVRLEPLTKAEMQRLQHVTEHMTNNDGWGRQSSYPWDTVAAADIDQYDFFALSAVT